MTQYKKKTFVIKVSPDKASDETVIGIDFYDMIPLVDMEERYNEDCRPLVYLMYMTDGRYVYTAFEDNAFERYISYFIPVREVLYLIVCNRAWHIFNDKRFIIAYQMLEGLLK